MRRIKPIRPMPCLGLALVLVLIWGCDAPEVTGPDSISPPTSAAFHKKEHPPKKPEIRDGRMTGGGSVFINGTRVTHGFQLQCDAADHRQNLQVNVRPEGGGQGDRWHLEELTFAECFMDPEFSPLPREAPINTYHGEGFGRWNGESGYFAEWIFTDEGEPGVNDRIVLLRITAPDGTIVLEVEDQTLTFGNHQAHPPSGGGPNGGGPNG